MIYPSANSNTNQKITRWFGYFRQHWVSFSRHWVSFLRHWDLFYTCRFILCNSGNLSLW